MLSLKDKLITEIEDMIEGCCRLDSRLSPRASLITLLYIEGAAAGDCVVFDQVIEYSEFYFCET